MKVSKIRIFDAEVATIAEALKNASSFTYTNHSNSMVVLGAEEYYWRNDAYQMNMVVLRKEEQNVVLDIIGAAGASSFFKMSWGSEKSFIKKVKRLIELICAKRNIHYASFEF